MLAVLLAPHQNCRYQASIEQLSRVELQFTLNAVGLDAQVCERVYAGHTALCVDAPCDDERLNRKAALELLEDLLDESDDEPPMEEEEGEDVPLF